MQRKPPQNTTARTRGDWQGMNWIRQDKRLAIYLRDGLACVWCGATVEDGATLTLDHLVPHSGGGANHEANLVTACKRCNDSRGSRALRVFAAAVAAYLNRGVLPQRVLEHVRACARRPLTEFRDEAKRLIARRGSCFAVLTYRRTA